MENENGSRDSGALKVSETSLNIPAVNSELVADDRLSTGSIGGVSIAEKRDGATNAHAQLTIERGASIGEVFPIGSDESNIGRWDADNGNFPDVDLDAFDPEAKVSRKHARIGKQHGEYFVEDLGSTNGTFVNRGRRLLPGNKEVLKDGDEIIVGKTFLRFKILV
jgi:pSer/pThr/pTyr-binding forkhead associated (FHA) protein